MTISEAIKKHGLEFLRGKAIQCGSEIRYIHNKCLDDDIELWEDEPENAHLIKRVYGGVTPDAKMVGWIYACFEVILAGDGA
jgi:hypothetical protein